MASGAYGTGSRGFRSGREWANVNLVSFGLIPSHSSRRHAGLCLGFPPHPHPNPLPEGEGIMPPSQGTTGGDSWTHLALFGLVYSYCGRLEMRPPWSRLALRSLVCGGPAWPCCRLWWPRHEWPGVEKLLIQLHFGSISFHSLSSTRGLAWGFTLILTFSPQGRRDLTAFHGNDVCEQCSNQQGYGVSGSCR